MDRLEKVELVREKCGVSYEEARDALEACGYDVLDAIVKLEREGKTAAQTACYATESERRHEVSPAMQVAQKQYEEQSRKTKFGELWEAFWKQVKRFIRATLDKPRPYEVYPIDPIIVKNTLGKSMPSRQEAYLPADP